MERKYRRNNLVMFMLQLQLELGGHAASFGSGFLERRDFSFS